MRRAATGLARGLIVRAGGGEGTGLLGLPGASRSFAKDGGKKIDFSRLGAPLSSEVGVKRKTALPPKPPNPSGKHVPESSSPVAKGGSATPVPKEWGMDTSASTSEASQAQRLMRDGLLKGFNMEKLGVGGMDAQLAQIFRRVFSSRAVPLDVAKALRIRHVKGMLLFGPPGTGKTLIARQLGQMLNAKPPKIVNGPEIMQKFVGQSEENLRNLFNDAEEDFRKHRDGSPLHVIIFDEIDAIMRQRGGGGGGSSVVHDSIVNQLLTKLDGVNKLTNVLVIGITNRKDMLDEALLRPGRLEVQIEVALPDAAGRRQILSIHSTHMRDAGVLGSDVCLDTIADATTNFSGAELEGLVTAAASFALDRSVTRARELTSEKAGDGEGGEEAGAAAGVMWAPETVTMTDFEQALSEVSPAFGAPLQQLKALAPHGIFEHGPPAAAVREKCRQLYRQVRDGQSTPVMSALLMGRPGTGKSALAGSIGLECGFPLVRIVTADSLVGRSGPEVCAALVSAFNEAYASQLSMVIVDDVERIVGYSRAGRVFNNAALQTLLVLLRRRPPHGRRLMVVCTSSMPDAMEYLEVDAATTVRLNVPPMSRDGAMALLTDMRCFGEERDREIAVAALPHETPVKSLYMLTKMAAQRSGLQSIDDGLENLDLGAWESSRVDMSNTLGGGLGGGSQRQPRRGVRRVHLPRRPRR